MTFFAEFSMNMFGPVCFCAHSKRLGNNWANTLDFGKCHNGYQRSLARAFTARAHILGRR